MDVGFRTFSSGWLGLERIVLRPFGLKCTPLEPAPQNQVGPTDVSKGQNCHGEHANIAEKEPIRVHSNFVHAQVQASPKTQGTRLVLENAQPLEGPNQISGQQMLPGATAPMGNMMGPGPSVHKIQSTKLEYSIVI